MNPKNFLYWFVVVILVVGVMAVGKALLIPFVLAVFIWYLINALTKVYGRIPIGSRRLPEWICFILSLITLTVFINLLIQLISNNVSDVVKLAPEYQKSLAKVVDKIFTALSIKEPLTLTQILGNLNVGSILSKFTRMLTGMIGNAGLIFVYLIFLFLEQKSFKLKISVLMKNPEQRTDLFNLLQKIDSDIRLYIGIKTLTSAITGILGYVVLSAVGVDFAEFWAVMLFIFNFIPTIGSIVATIFPSILALVQFNSFYPFFIVTGGLIGIQFFIGNLLDPKLMGNSLNLSPLFIILSLMLWGAVWGVAGMILCVPIMVIMMIVFSHFPNTRPVAILLSRDGNIKR